VSIIPTHYKKIFCREFMLFYEIRIYGFSKSIFRIKGVDRKGRTALTDYTVT
jgi:hypothetical protein